MSEEESYSSRSYKRKRKKVQKIFNIAIIVVVFMVLLVGRQVLFSGKSSETVVENNNERNEVVDNIEGEAQEVISEENNIEEADGVLPSSDDRNDEEIDTSNIDTSEATPSQPGEWKPIGTVQEEPFSAVYSKEHINWREMTKAFQYATGLGEDMTIWHVGNGGDNQSAVGIVADATTRATPYQVRIEWVTNEGWMPVSVQRLDENPYMSR
ncbi:hypothetical protein BKP45_04810 [Anaerobacillus alkalidiazotrophicus]|uniref:DUF1510 domain-containing protein n=1 Tax=Anaerobacillus alkalidiazotrophicus TaxID=472963 RepID=A0A1S2MBC8_9BACI|nr:YrrS family protein [Anaerobacillus alkalidiazotrophicus]OIJ22001.1 hypothetical protein BKP45_04810 [Anaerobacillus alkalidiazotrophicus]